MFIERSLPIDFSSSFMGERELVALLEELPSLIGLCFLLTIHRYAVFPTAPEGATQITQPEGLQRK